MLNEHDKMGGMDEGTYLDRGQVRQEKHGISFMMNNAPFGTQNGLHKKLHLGCLNTIWVV